MNEIIASSPTHSSLTVDLEKLAPHSSSVIADTLRVETPCTTISIKANASVERARPIAVAVALTLV